MEAHITEILLTQALQPFSLGAEGKHCSQSPSHSKQRCLDTVLWSHVLPSVVTLERLSFQFSHYIIYKNTPRCDPSTKGTQEHRWRSVLVWEDAELKPKCRLVPSRAVQQHLASWTRVLVFGKHLSSLWETCAQLPALRQASFQTRGIYIGFVLK